MREMENTFRIRKISSRLRLLFQVATWLVPLIPVAFWLWYNDLPQVMHEHIFAGVTITTLPLNSRLIALAGGVPATAITVLALIKLARLFSLYERGVFFQAENVLLFRALGRLAFFSVLADIFNKTVLDIARTINNPPGQRVLSIGFSSDHLKLIIVAVIIMLIGMVIDEGRKVHEEMELTV